MVESSSHAQAVPGRRGVDGAEFRSGSFRNTVVSFFLAVKRLGVLLERRKAGLEPEAEAVPEDVVLLGEIRIG